jgi:hypothetical protein
VQQVSGEQARDSWRVFRLAAIGSRLTWADKRDGVVAGVECWDHLCVDCGQRPVHLPLLWDHHSLGIVRPAACELLPGFNDS